ncbi:MAG: methylmalonyl-CoA mutase family protein [Armatimonadota bacterium]|nr:methylmalonyl-CoA mutase family protein [Armatimonadota bacterium]
MSDRPDEVSTADGIPLPAVPRAEHVRAAYQATIGEPGAFPYTRGIYPTMYRGRLWTMRQYAGFGSAEESNRRYRYLLDQGQTGLSIAFDLPTQMGYDSDHPLARPEIGRVGVAVDTLADMEVLLDGIPLGRVSTSMTINATAAILLAMYVAVAEKQGVPAEHIDGTTQNDILKEYIARGTYIYPPAASMRIVTDVVRYCAERLPRWNPISVSGYHIREAGATAVQEVAFTLANGLTYLQAAIDAGLRVDQVAPAISFFFAAQMHVLEEVAKFRAARRLWARLVQGRYAPQDPRSTMLRFHTQTAGAALTAQQPDNNVVRVTLQALAAVLGGTQSLHTNGRDEALALPTEASALLALRTQQIIAHESGVTAAVDPLAGAYLVEYLTDEIEQRAEGLISQIEAGGGMLRAIERGWVQRDIADSAYREAQAIERGDRVVVGVNRFQSDAPARVELHRVDPSVADRQLQRLDRVRRERDARAAQRALTALADAARGTDSLMPPILEAVRAYASVGEICDVLRSVFGPHRPAVTV